MTRELTEKEVNTIMRKLDRDGEFNVFAIYDDRTNYLIPKKSISYAKYDRMLDTENHRVSFVYYIKGWKLILFKIDIVENAGIQEIEPIKAIQTSSEYNETIISFGRKVDYEINKIKQSFVGNRNLSFTAVNNY